MTIEEMIAAKTRLIEVGANTGIGISVGLLILSLVLFGQTKRSANDNSDTTPVWLVLSLLFSLTGIILLGGNIYDKYTAELRVKVQMSNYNLVEIKK